MDSMKEKLDLANCGACACMNLRKTSRAITQYYDRALQPVGLRATQFTILVAVAKAESITISKLAEFLVMDRTTLTRNIRPLEREGYLEIRTGSDQRKRYLYLLKKGETVLEKALPLWQVTQQNIVRGLGIDNFRKMLITVNDTISLTR